MMRISRFRLDIRPAGNYPETGFWEARQIGTDKSASHQEIKH
jgi:hypothetical protein